MHVMAESKGKNVLVKPSLRVHATLKRIVAELADTEAFRERRRMLSQETVIAASWLWMGDMGVEELAEKLAPYVRAVEWPEAEPSENPGRSENPAPRASKAVSDREHKKTGRKSG